MSRLLLVCLVIVVTCTRTSGQESKKEIRAVVEELDPEVGTLTVVLPEGGKNRADRIRTYNLIRRDLPVTDAAGNLHKLTDLKPEDRVLLRLSGEDVTSIGLAPPQIYGILTKIDPMTRVLEVRSKMGERTLTVPAAAKLIGPGGSEFRLDELKTGTTILVEFGPDLKTVLDIRTGKGVAPAAKMTKGTGVLIDLDREQAKVRIFSTSSFGDHSLLRELGLTRDAGYTLLYQSKHFRDLGADELSKGLKVHYWIDSATRKVAHLQVEAPILGRRNVKAVDASRGEMTLEDGDGDRVLKITPHTKILTARGPAGLEAVHRKAVTCALSPDRTTAEVVSVLPK